MRYISPHLNNFYSKQEGEGFRRGDIIFDSTAMNAVGQFVSTVQASYFPAMSKWLQLEAGPRIDPNAVEQLNAKLQATTDIVFQYIHGSNFDTEISRALYDFALGVGSLMIQNTGEANPLRFNSVPISEIFTLAGPFGKIDTIFRKCKMTRRVIEGTWPEATIPDWMKESTDLKKEYLVVDAVVPEPDGMWAYEVFLPEKKEKIFTEMRRRNPWVVFRWPSRPNEVWSAGPVIHALPDIKTLNKVKELALKGAALEVYPPLRIMNDGVINIDNLKYAPGSKMIVEPLGGTMSPIEPLRVGVNPQLAQFVINDMQQAIQKALFADPIGDVDLPVKSATEIAVRDQEMLKRGNSAFGFLHFEAVIPIMELVLAILEEEQIIDLDGLKLSDGTMQINYKSPIARAAAAQEVQNIVQYSSILTQLYGELGIGLQDPKAISKHIAEMLGVPKDIRPSDEEIAQAEQAASQMMAQQQLAAQGGQTPA